MTIDNEDAERLARELAELTGQSPTDAVKTALRYELWRARTRNAGGKRPLIERLTEISERCASLPDYDTRTPDEIIGYDENGLPG